MPPQKPQTSVTVDLEALARQMGGEIPDLEAMAKAMGGDTDPKRAPIAGRGTGYDPRNSDANVQAVVKKLPLIAGIGAGLVTGGMGAIPAMLTAGAATGAGSLLRSALDDKPETAGQAIGTATKEAVLGGILPEGVARAFGTFVPPAVRAARNKIADVLAQSALKPGLRSIIKDVRAGKAVPDVVRAMIKEGVNPTPAGISKVNAFIEATNDEIYDAVSSLKGETISPSKVAGRVDRTERAARGQAVPLEDTKIVQGNRDQFLNHEMTTKRGQIGTQSVPSTILGADGKAAFTTQVPVMGRVPKNMTPLEAHEMKVDTYRSLQSKNYGDLKSVDIESQKALALGLKEEVAHAAAEAGVDITKLNAREGMLIELKEAMAKRVALAGNRDPVSVAWLAQHPLMGIMYVVEKSPAVKSMLARGLYTSASKASGVPSSVLRLLMQSLAASGGGDGDEKKEEE